MLTKERIEELRKEEEEQDAENKKRRKEEQREQRRLRDRIRKESMNIPLDPLPERELCEYEKYREKNITERERIMAESGFFDDLIAFKKEIGLVKNSSPNISDHGSNAKKYKTKEDNHFVEN